MATLPLIDWPEDLIDQRLSFLRSAARFVPPAANDGERTSISREPSRGEVTDVHALLAAVDMAFATDRTAVGINLLANAVDAMIKRGDLEIAALPGSILGRVATKITADDIAIIDDATKKETRVAFPPPLSSSALDLVSDLLVASLVDGLPTELDDKFFKEWPKQVMGLGEPLLQALAAFRQRDNWPAAQTGLIANTALWVERLGRCRMDKFHWEQGRVRGRLIDFRRVVFEIALIRRKDVWEFRNWWLKSRLEGLAGEIDHFVRQLATEIVNGRKQ